MPTQIWYPRTPWNQTLKVSNLWSDRPATFPSCSATLSRSNPATTTWFRCQSQRSALTRASRSRLIRWNETASFRKRLGTLFIQLFFAEIFALDYIVLFPLWTEWISTSQDLLGRQFSSQLYPLTRIMVYERRSFIDSIGIYFVVTKSFWIGNSSF